MRVWLTGQKSFGVAVFEMLTLKSGVEVVGVTAPRADALDVACRRRRGEWPKEETLTREQVEEAGADLIVNAHGVVRIGRDAREAAPLGAIGYHPSLLPRHRGRSAIEWTLAMGDPIAGGTVYELDDGWDTGPIIAQDWCHIAPGWTASDLWREALFAMGVRLLRDVVGAMVSGVGVVRARQHERFATYEPPWETVGTAGATAFWSDVRTGRRVGR